MWQMRKCRTFRLFGIHRLNGGFPHVDVSREVKKMHLILQAIRWRNTQRIIFLISNKFCLRGNRIYSRARGLMAINVGCEFPACARSRMLTLGKLANLNHILSGGLLLD